MKRFAFLAFLPVVLFALETVNLIKDHSFEEDSELWQVYAGGDGNQDSAVVNRHDFENTHSGSYSASSDTRKLPGNYWVFYDDSAMVMQGFCCRKLVSDIDTLTMSYSIIPVGENFNGTAAIFIALYLNAGGCIAGYYHKGPTLGDPTPIPPRKYIGVEGLPSDTNWCTFSWNLKADLLNAGISSSTPSDSFLIMGWGIYWPPWKGQKVYWDDVRLMGYADYDVGVKEILSGDSLKPDTAYVPEARIKNFGREPADSFLVIAEIAEESGLDSAFVIWADTLPYSLPSDTEETVSLAEFTPDHPGLYTLTIRTVMEPDESDEDDELSKPLIYVGIEEEPPLEGITFDVQSLSTIRYSLPYATHVSLKIYDVSGRLVTKLVDGEVTPGVHELRWTGKDDVNRRCASGVYFVRFTAGDYKASKKMVLIK